MTPEMQPVVSEAVASIGYDEEPQEVYVEFNNGRTYVYLGVPNVGVAGLRDIGQQGRFREPGAEAQLRVPGSLSRPPLAKREGRPPSP